VAASPANGNVALEVVVEGDFDLELPARAFHSDGTFSESRLVLGPGTSSHSLGGAPVLIQLDPEWTAVREIRSGADVSFDGAVDGIDLIEVALRIGAYLPSERRRDGSYDPLYDLDDNRTIDELDLTAITEH
jgi:hypothetical protein